MCQGGCKLILACGFCQVARMIFARMIQPTRKLTCLKKKLGELRRCCVDGVAAARDAAVLLALVVFLCTHADHGTPFGACGGELSTPNQLDAEPRHCLVLDSGGREVKGVEGYRLHLMRVK